MGVKIFCRIEFKDGKKIEELKTSRDAWLLLGGKPKLKQEQVERIIKALGISEMIDLYNVACVGGDYIIYLAFGWGEDKTRLYFFNQDNKITTILLKKYINKMYIKESNGGEKLVWPEE